MVRSYWPISRLLQGDLDFVGTTVSLKAQRAQRPILELLHHGLDVMQQR